MNSMNNIGETALMNAAHTCWDRRVTRLLINAGANVNAKAEDGQTPLIVAAVEGNEEAVGELVRAGANVNATDETGIPLWRSPEIVKWDARSLTTESMRTCVISRKNEVMFSNRDRLRKLFANENQKVMRLFGTSEL